MNICQIAQHVTSGALILIALFMILFLALTIKEALWLHKIDKNSRIHGGGITSWTEYREKDERPTITTYKPEHQNQQDKIKQLK